MQTTMTILAIGTGIIMLLLFFVGIANRKWTMMEGTIFFVSFFIFAWSFGMAHNGGTVDEWLQNPTECCECEDTR